MKGSTNFTREIKKDERNSFPVYVKLDSQKRGPGLLLKLALIRLGSWH